MDAKDGPHVVVALPASVGCKNCHLLYEELREANARLERATYEANAAAAQLSLARRELEGLSR